jgi:LysM repeat protein
MLLGSLISLKVIRSSTLTPVSLAILESVSPLLTSLITSPPSALAVRSEREKFRYAEGGEVIREVKGGDTLSKIAKETGVSVEDLITFNDIKDPNNIQVGQPLRLKREEGRLSAIRKEAIRQTKKTFDSFEQSISNAIPTNARAFGKFLLGNIFGSESRGEDIDVGSLGEEQQKVLKQAMINAEKKGRAYVTYDDYPTMADGQAVNDFYNQKRKDTDLIDLAKASFTDPVFEMFTSLGAFNFTKDSKGNFEVLPDKYDFDKSKSTAEDRAKPKDDYSRLTYLGQDISENKDAYGFNFKGRINVAKGGKIDKKKMACNRPKRTASHPKKSHVVKACEGGKEKIIRFGEQGAKTAGKPKAGESARMKAKRKSFKARHRRNIKRGKMSAAYWADKVKW